MLFKNIAFVLFQFLSLILQKKEEQKQRVRLESYITEIDLLCCLNPKIFE